MSASPLGPLKTYRFIRPEPITAVQLYEFMGKQPDLYDMKEHPKHEFIIQPMNRLYGFLLTYHMIQHKATLAHFTTNRSTGNLELMLVDDTVHYKKRRYRIKYVDRLQPDDQILFAVKDIDLVTNLYVVSCEPNYEQNQSNQTNIKSNDNHFIPA